MQLLVFPALLMFDNCSKQGPNAEHISWLEAEHISWLEASIAAFKRPGLQGLATGNYSFQVKAIDVAGNAGKATTNYVFAVDSQIKAGAQTRGRFWGLGWKFWLIIGAGSFVVLAAISALAAVTAMRLRKRGPAQYSRQENLVVYRHPKAFVWGDKAARESNRLLLFWYNADTLKYITIGC